MKSIKILIALCPVFVFGQETVNSKSVQKPYVTYCNENGDKTLNYVPLCDSLNVSDNNLKITSFTFKSIQGEKIITTEMASNKLSGVMKNMIKFSKERVIYFEEIKAINTTTNKEVLLPMLKISWDTN